MKIDDDVKELKDEMKALKKEVKALDENGGNIKSYHNLEQDPLIRRIIAQLKQRA